MLNSSFFDRPVLTICPDLLGKYLVYKTKAGSGALLIHEIEAYDGPYDLASHGRFGKTERTEAMFGPSGHWYVYLVYGMYWMLNIVTCSVDYPAAILIRGAGDFNGPGKLTKNLGIDKTFNNAPACTKTGLWIEDRGFVVKPEFIEKTPRIGISYAGPIWSQVPYRFVLKQK